MPKEHDPNRTLWNGIGSLLIQGAAQATTDDGTVLLLPPKVTTWVALLANSHAIDSNRVLNARLVGMAYGTQNSVVNEVIDESLPVHLSLLGIASAEVAQVVMMLIGNEYMTGQTIALSGGMAFN